MRLCSGKPILLGSTILIPFRLCPDSIDSLFHVFRSDSTFVDLDISFVCTFGLHMFSGHSLICSPCHTSLCFSRALCFHHLTFSWTPQFLCCSYCLSLIVLRSSFSVFHQYPRSYLLRISIDFLTLVSHVLSDFLGSNSALCHLTSPLLLSHFLDPGCVQVTGSR